LQASGQRDPEEFIDDLGNTWEGSVQALRQLNQRETGLLADRFQVTK
jgi:hypothetical protein